MDLSRRLRAWALARPRVLVVDARDTVELRWAVEAELDRRGWSPALSPADADVLLVLGAPGSQLTAAIDVLWSQIAQPRHRVDLHTVTDLHHRLDEAVRVLGTSAREPGEDGSGGAGAGREGMDHGGGGHEGMDHGGGGHEGMDHGTMDDSGHEGHHMHHGGDVAGLPMAETAPDRDGLALDVLRVSIGPVLPGWPTGLLLQADLQGDILTGARLSWVDATDDEIVPAERVHPQRAALDQLASLLVVAGWPTAARDARCARDGLASTDQSAVAVARRRAALVARRVGRSRALAWSVRGAGRLPSTAGAAADGDVLDRVRRWCDLASGGTVGAPASPSSLDAVAAVLEGTELGTARLIVASLALDRSPARTEPEDARA